MKLEQYSRTIGLLGENTFNLIRNKKILIAGLGGVGGTAFEALIRIGFKHFVIIDKDIVTSSNLNRQILYVASDIGKAKVEVAKSRALAIDDEIDIKTYQGNVLDILDFKDVDIVVDCIDDIKAKVALIKYTLVNNIALITSTGMANKMDPSCLAIAPLNKSSVDPLAKKLRYELKKDGVDISKVMALYSSELPKKDGAKLNSLITVTSSAGLYIANYVLNVLQK